MSPEERREYLQSLLESENESDGDFSSGSDEEFVPPLQRQSSSSSSAVSGSGAADNETNARDADEESDAASQIEIESEEEESDSDPDDEDAPVVAPVMQGKDGTVWNLQPPSNIVQTYSHNVLRERRSTHPDTHNQTEAGLLNLIFSDVMMNSIVMDTNFKAQHVYQEWNRANPIAKPRQ